MALKTLGNDDASGSDGVMSEINITPLVDVFLVLLIIFMVTSSVMSQLGVDVNLPQASKATAEAQPDGVIVTLLPGGDVKLNQETFKQDRLAEFGTRLKAALGQGTSRLVVLEGDRQAFLGSAIQIMDIARQAGALKFAIATAPESP